MTLDRFTQQVRRQPFRPFQLVMVDGSRFTVDHPDFVPIDRRGRAVTFHATDNTRHELDAWLIQDVVALNADASATVGGPKWRESQRRGAIHTIAKALPKNGPHARVLRPHQP